MPSKNPDLHGNVPDKSSVALLIIDVINDLEFPDNKSIVQKSMTLGRNIAALKQRARKAGIPAIYVNDNFGKWRSDFKKQIDHCINDDVCGRPLSEMLRPDDKDYFVLKPKHSGFFSTTLDTLLIYLETRVLILTGIAGDRCVLFTANDAFLRDFHLLVPSDCVISNHPKQNHEALKLMERVLNADIRPSRQLNLSRIKKSALNKGN